MPSDCACVYLYVGSERTNARDWNPECAEHGVDSDWYHSDEQVARRNERADRLDDLYRRAREARAAARTEGDDRD